MNSVSVLMIVQIMMAFVLCDALELTLSKH